MQTFLEEVTQYIYTHHQHELGNSCIIFPNKRAGLFFRKYLSNLIDKPVILPEIVTINEIFSRISGLKPSENFILAAELYQVYCHVRRSPESFDDFYPWAETLIADFDDLDKYLVDAEKLFANITDLRELDLLFDFPDENVKSIIQAFWRTVQFSRDSDEKKKFLEFWKLLLPLYHQFGASLRSKGIGYDGMIYRDALDLLKKTKEVQLPYDRYFIAGLNALSECEKQLLHVFRKQNKAVFFWDYDQSYISGTNHEAGYFMRQNLKEFKSPENFSLPSYFPDAQRKVQLIAVPTTASQVRLAGRYVEQFMQKSTDPLHTAVVFADEKFLLPMLQTMPESCDQVNITMGFPVMESLGYGIISLIMELQRNARMVRGSLHFYYRNVLAILYHPFLSLHNEPEIRDLIIKIKKGNHIMVETGMLQWEGLDEIFHQTPTNGKEYAGYLLDIIFSLVKKLQKNGSEQKNLVLEKEILHRMYTSLQHLSTLAERGEIEMKVDTFVSVVKKMMQSQRVAFSGEPLAGVQLLGLLETRVLDFENLILLQANEGTLPQSSLAPSFIPPNLRYAYGMPTLEHQDAIFAYYFYRLLHRAKNTVIFWNSGHKDPGAGTMSRYLYQLVYEQILPVEQFTPGTHIQSTGSLPVEFLKKEKVLEHLKDYLTSRYLSPTAISDYLNCTLQFYLRHVLKIRPSEEMLEDADGGITGTLFHEAANILYEPLKGTTITAVILEQILSKPDPIDTAVSEAFRKVIYTSIPVGKKPEPQGPYIILQDVLKKYLFQLVQNDIKQTPFYLLALETTFKRTWIPRDKNIFKEITLGGKVDRLERKADTIRIIDYKTGAGKTTFSNLDQLFDRESAGNYKASLQALYYALLVEESYPLEKVQPLLYFMKELFKPDFKSELILAKDPIIEFRRIREVFLEKTGNLIEEIINQDISFTQTNDPVRCRYCDFREYCRRR